MRATMTNLLKPFLAVTLSLTVFVNLDQQEAQAVSSPNREQDARPLELGKPVERELAGGEVHSYQITLAAGQYLRLIVEQRGIDVALTLFGPDGGKIVEVDSPNGAQGPEPVSVIAEAAGTYRVEVRSLEKGAKAGRYEARLEELRPAREQDKSRVAAERAFAEAMLLRAQGGAESTRRSLEKYEEALRLSRIAGDRFREAQTLNSLGETHSSLSEPRKALDYFNQALPLWRSLGDQSGEAIALGNLGVIYFSLGERQPAIDHYRQALPLLRAAGDRGSEAATLNNLGAAHRSLGEMPKALDYFHQALKLNQEIGDRRGEAFTLGSLASIHDSLGEKQKALGYLHRALPLSRAVQDRRAEATTLDNLGSIYNSLGEKQQALDFYRQALPLSQAIGDRRTEARTLNNFGLVYNSLGEKQKALDYYRQALALRRAIGDRGGEASTLNNLGVVYISLGEMQRALDHYHQALQLHRAVGARGGEANTLTNIGGIYDILGEETKALSYYQQALPLIRAVGDRRQEAITLDWVGGAYHSLGEKAKALEAYQQAIRLSREVGDRRQEAITLHNLGALHYSLGEKQQALDFYRQSLPLRRAVGDRYGEAYTLTNIGDVYVSLNEPQTALENYHQALALRRAVEDRPGEAQTLHGIARAERDSGRLDEARSRIEAALGIIELLRTGFTSQDLRASYFATAQKHHAFYVDLLMQLHKQRPSEGHDAAALQASERARARGLLELLAEARADIRQGVDPTLLERERALQQLLNAKAERQTRLLSGSHTREQAEEAAKEIETLTAQFREAQARIRAASPRYAALTQPQPLSLKEIQPELDADTLLLEYALGDERSYLWAVSPTSIASYELPKRDEINAAARRFYEAVKTDEQNQEAMAAARDLSRMLLSPVSAQLGKKRLVIVADGALQYAPFAALPKPEAGDRGLGAGKRNPPSRISTPPSQISTPPSRISNLKSPIPNPQPLIINHEIISLPSASTLAVLRRETAGRAPAAKTVAVLADPVFEADDPRVKRARLKAEEQTVASAAGANSAPVLEPPLERSLRESGARLARLLHTRREAAGILALAPEAERKQAIDFEANRAAATDAELGQYRYVHFATHGLLNSAHPELSGIALSLVDEQGRPQDGFLRLHEIYNLKLPVELVALSACQTGLGKEVKGEGLVGLTRGFMYAGASRVAASLWRVDDRATAELMKHFYQGMLGPRKLRPAAALRAAQIAMLRQQQWQAPYYWAAFVLQGEWR